jgi:hypothetical protein
MWRPPALALVVLLLAACGSGHSTGVLTGEIRGIPATTPLPGVGPNPGQVIVSTSSGRIVARERVDRASHLRYRIVLPPGEYYVNAGSLIRYNPPWNCRPQHARVQAGGTSQVNVYTGCGVQ